MKSLLETFQRRTILEALLDLLILLAGWGSVWLAYFGNVALTRPILGVREEAARFAGDPFAAQRVTQLLAERGVSIEGLLAKLIILYAAILLLFMSVYVLLKMRIWATTLGKAWSWRGAGRLLMVVQGGVLGLVLLDLFLWWLLPPVAVGVALATEVVILLLVMPLLFASSYLGWKPRWMLLLFYAVVGIVWIVVGSVIGLSALLHPVLYQLLLIAAYLIVAAWARRYLAQILEAQQ